MPEPFKFLFRNSYKKRFLWTHKEVDLAPHPVVGLVLQVGDAEKFPQALGFNGLDPFVFVFWSVSKQSPCFTAVEQEEGVLRLVQIELACEVDGVAPPDPV